ncbi:NYN domain-containing protein [Streptomyces clavuligerus]|uniref:NYN domain-containing protein n=1 Tax=Streptomyces clavuligerus TaxID=1901 RepID=UPI0018D136D4|nr:NYN domain-containing protein [Streptomyces clavuligerus]
MDRCVVLVDAGYLLGAAASLLAGEPARSRITVDHTALIQGLRELAERDTERPLLRIYWFDGAPDRVPQPEHRRLRVMPRVTVRLGALTRSDGRWAQKGVDAAMHAELTELARNRACSDVVLVTGDGDLLPGLMSAKEHGVAVHLWAVQAADGDYNQSEDLVAEADERRVLRGLGAGGAQHPATATLRWSSDKGWIERPGGGAPGEPPESASLPTLAQLTSAEQRWADREEDITTVGGDPFEVGQVFARRWMERLPEAGHVQKLSVMYPRIPHRIDGELLRYAARFGLLAHKDDQIDEHDRYAIRAGFWREIDVRTAGDHTSAGE